MADASEDSRNDRNQLNFRMDDAEADISRIETQWRSDRDEIVRLRAEFNAFKSGQDKGGERMWAVILIAIGTLANVGAAIFMAVKK